MKLIELKSIILLLFVLLAAYYFNYLYTNTVMKKSYAVFYGNCIERQADPDSHIDSERGYLECSRLGGCLDPCGSACFVHRDSAGFLDLVGNFLKKSSKGANICTDECVPRCYFPDGDVIPQ
jgi:hypothetical protein